MSEHTAQERVLSGEAWVEFCDALKEAGKLVNAPLTGGTGVGLPGNTLRSEALSALISLGLDRMKAERALHAVLQERKGEEPALEELIKLTLKNL